MSNVLKMLSRGGAIPAPTDPNFNQTVLLLHGDGTNGAQNNTFLDSSTNNFTITRNGNTTQGTFSPFSVEAGKWSNYFDGTGDYLSFADSADFTLTGDFTIQCWIYQTGSFSLRLFLSKWDAGGQEFYLYTNTGGVVGLAWGAFDTAGYTNPLLESASSAVSLNTWTHIAVTRSSNTFTLYVNGVSADTASFSTGASNGPEPLYVGIYDGSSFGFEGYISNLQIVNGTATAPPSGGPTSPLSPSTTNQKLLTCYSNRFVDANTATTAKTATVAGNTSVQPFSPFAPSAAYSASVNGGSGYFDGSGDYLTAPDDADFNFGSGSFTIEGWIYPTGTGLGILYSKASADNNGVILAINNGATGRISFYADSTGSSTWEVLLDSTTNVPLNAWSHVAAVRNSNTWTIYINGVASGTTTSSITPTNQAVGPSIGFFYAGLPANYQGYVSSYRVVKGTAVYTSGFSVPTAPFEESDEAGTELLLNFTNAGIFDNTGKNNLETVGNAQIDTGTKKYGTGSMEFDGTGDWLIQNPIQTVAANENFTFECWINMNNNSTLGAWFSGVAVICYCVSADDVFASSSTDTASGYTTQITSSTTYSSGTWYHYALVRNGTGSNNITLYIDGVSVGTVTSNIALDFQYIGVQKGATGRAFSGYLDEVRLTRGVARYTTTFTPPTAALPNL